MALAALKKEYEVWDTAVKTFDQGRLDKALSLFESMEQNTQIVMNTGLICTMKEDYEESIKHYTRAIAQNCYLALAYFQRALCYYKLERRYEAEADLCTAEVMMRGKTFVPYNEQGLDFTLHKAEILFNKGVVVTQCGRVEEGTAIFQKAKDLRLGDEQQEFATQAINGRRDFTLCSVPPGVLYRPMSTKMKFLQTLKVTRSDTPPANTLHYTKSIPDLSSNIPYDPASDDDSSTCAGSSASVESLSLKKNQTTGNLSSPRASLSSYFAPSSSSSSSRALRSDLTKAMGIDILSPTTEIDSIPCAGVRIGQGKLAGLMAWRFVVSLDDQKAATTRRQQMKQRHWRDVVPGKSVVVNFILDTGRANSTIPQEALRALGYRGSYKPGTELILRVQGVSTKCTVAHLGGAGRLGSQFMTAGSLTFYFDTKLDAPVLYVADELNDRPSDIPRTVEPDRKLRRLSFKEGVTALIHSLSLRG